MRWGTLPGLSRQSWSCVASSAAWLRPKSKRNAMGLNAASRKSGAEVVQGCRTGQRAAWMHGVATAARQFFGVQNVAYSGIMTIYRSYRINHLTGAADASSTAGTSYKRVTPMACPRRWRSGSRRPWSKPSSMGLRGRPIPTSGSRSLRSASVRSKRASSGCYRRPLSHSCSPRLHSSALKRHGESDDEETQEHQGHRFHLHP